MGEGMKRQIIKHLPEELTTEILSNLPVKSLLRFQSVSKPWRSLISSAKFVKDHLNRSNSDPDLAHHSLIGNFYDKETGLSVSSCSLKSLLVEPNQDDVVPTWDHTGLYSISILGSCNGLILYTERLFHGYWFHLWNPSTRQLKTISPPSSRPQEYAHLPYHYYVYGFGYDDLTDDYKVVWVMSSYRGGQEIHRTEIYTVRTDSWKKIENFEKSFHSLDCLGKFVNGKLHWLVWEEEEDVWTIVSLGLVEGEEKYQVVAMPSNYDPCGPTLENLGGYLSLIGSLVGANGMVDINIWVMMKYGVAESWTKIWTLSDFHDRRPICSGVKPFWVTKNGDIFVGFDKSKVMVYNAKNKLREYGINKDELQPPPENSTTSEDDHFYECSASLNEPLLVYVESLVSP